MDIVERLRGSVCYASTNKEWPNVLLQEAADEIERLRARLEWSPDHPYDGIACRDETIRLQDEAIDRPRGAHP